MSDTNQPDEDSVPVTRRVINIVGGLGVVTFFGALLTPAKDLAVASTSSEAAQLAGQQLVFAEDDESTGASKGTVVTTDLLGDPPSSILAYPERLSGSNEYLIRLSKLEPERISEPTKLEWVDQGLVAYSAICTHLGCTIDWEDSDEEPQTVPEAEREGASALCPCHLSSFDVYEGATVLGGPASRPVPQIGVTVTEEGAVELTSEFEADIGGE